jgi:hypothetical protein
MRWLPQSELGGRALVDTAMSAEGQDPIFKGDAVAAETWIAKGDCGGLLYSKVPALGRKRSRAQ